MKKGLQIIKPNLKKWEVEKIEPKNYEIEIMKQVEANEKVQKKLEDKMSREVQAYNA